MAACQSGSPAESHRNGYDNKGMTTGMTTRYDNGYDNKVKQHGVQRPRMSDAHCSTCQMLWSCLAHSPGGICAQDSQTELAKPTQTPNRRPGYDNGMTKGMTMV